MKETNRFSIRNLMSIVSLFVLLFAITACGDTNKPAISSNNADNPEGTTENQDKEKVIEQLALGSQGTVFGDWSYSDKAIDEFGDETNVTFVSLKSVILDGTFSNSATTDSKLFVAVADTIPEDLKLKERNSVHCISFVLLEYGENPANHLSNSVMTLKTKVDDAINEYKIKSSGGANGELILGIDDKGGDELHDYLLSGKDVRCIIYNDESKYNFTISSNGFADACSKAQDKLDSILAAQKAEAEKDSINTPGKAIKAFVEDNSDKTDEAYEFLLENYKSIPQMTTEEIKKELKGELFLWVN